MFSPASADPLARRIKRGRETRNPMYAFFFEPSELLLCALTVACDAVEPIVVRVQFEEGNCSLAV